MNPIFDSCCRGRLNTKWRFYKLINLAVFAVFFKDVPMGCKDAVLPKPLLKNQTINCLTFEENTRQPYNNNLCIFRALALLLQGNQKLQEEASKIVNLFINRMDGLSLPQLRWTLKSPIRLLILRLKIFVDLRRVPRLVNNGTMVQLS